MSKDDVVGCAPGIAVDFELVFLEQATGANLVSWNQIFASPVVM